MNFTRAEPDAQWRKFPSLRRSFRRASRAKALEIALREPERTREPDPDRAHRGLEEATADFRLALSKKHVARVREEYARSNLAIEAWKGSLKADDGREELSVANASNMWGDPIAEATGELVARGPCVIPASTLEDLEDSVTTRHWHEGRAKGQVDRFDRVRDCGTRMLIASCQSCNEDAKPIKEPCGVRRVCQRCEVSGAMKRRARFGRARARAMIDADRYGLGRKCRKGGRYTEKMLTLTVPHGTLETATGEVKEEARDDTHARMVALFRAWPRLIRKVNRHFFARWEKHVSYHRAFEWTPGLDGIGHPHFHVYMWCPWIARELIREWWAESLREVGWPVERRPAGSARVYGGVWGAVTVEGMGGIVSDVIVDLRMLRGFNIHAIREFMKGGRRGALTLSRIEFSEAKSPGLDAYKYAEGWTIGDIAAFCSVDVVARLYCALEAKRLSQGSKGFFVEDEPAICLCCGSSTFRVRFEPIPVPVEPPPCEGSGVPP